MYVYIPIWRSSGWHPSSVVTAASSFGDVYQFANTGSCKSGCIICWTPQESGFSSPYGGNCFPTVRRWGHDPSRVSFTTRWHAPSSLFQSSSWMRPDTITYPCCSYRVLMSLRGDAIKLETITWEVVPRAD